MYFVPVTINSKAQNSNPDVVAHIRTLTGFFFTGGDQSRLIYSLYNNDEKEPSPVLRAIRETLFSSGGVVAGTSAGTDCMTSAAMISGGYSYNGLVNGTTLFWRSLEFKDETILSSYAPGLETNNTFRSQEMRSFVNKRWHWIFSSRIFGYSFC